MKRLLAAVFFLGSSGWCLTAFPGMGGGSSGGGGSGTPGGADTEIQYNNGGAFAGDSLFTFDDSTKFMSLGGATWDLAPTMLTIRNQGVNYSAAFLSSDWATGSAGQALYLSALAGGVGIVGASSGGSSFSSLQFNPDYIATAKMKLGGGLGTAPLNDFEIQGEAVIGSSAYVGVETAPPDGLLVEGQVGIATNPVVGASTLTVNGVIESLSGGYKFPDGTTQTTAAGSESLKRQMVVILDGGGVAISTGTKRIYSRVPCDMTLTGWDIVADQSGSIVVDFWKDSYANFPPTVADTFAGSEKPTLSSQQTNQDTSLTSMTTSLSAGDYIEVNVDSASTVTKVSITLYGVAN